ncbi:bifunctional SANT-Myb domain/Homeobox-like domain superfamily/SANT domain [Babesia duncani]|uniref:Bifunctional SANT-Myb domain/Homeobox-like domain superfamily/SANT domain n=1 Tax=Babesia duncani TaxID=323732 RepID=A0AAD9PPC8_9APIC|nr:bifunctional SANT-Myb domain/Homeobox-like domain superfamily/SANT domain [Babesia duncani]
MMESQSHLAYKVSLPTFSLYRLTTSSSLDAWRTNHSYEGFSHNINQSEKPGRQRNTRPLGKISNGQFHNGHYDMCHASVSGFAGSNFNPSSLLWLPYVYRGLSSLEQSVAHRPSLKGFEFKCFTDPRHYQSEDSSVYDDVSNASGSLAASRESDLDVKSVGVLDHLPSWAMMRSHHRLSLPSIDPNCCSVLDTLVNCIEESVKVALEEMINITVMCLEFRMGIYNALCDNKDINSTSFDILNNHCQMQELVHQLEQYLVKIDNQLISLHYARNMLDGSSESSFDNQKMESPSQPQSSRTYRSIESNESNVNNQDSDDESLEQADGFDSTNVEIVSPCVAMYLALENLQDNPNYLMEMDRGNYCSTGSGFLYDGSCKSVATSTRSVENIKPESEEMILHSPGAWITDLNYAAKVAKNNNARKFDSTIDLISDMCSVAIAEVRIPKPEWNECTEYNCVNGYCCTKCCTCTSKEVTRLNNLNVPNVNLSDEVKFEMEATVAKLDLHRVLLGTCSCICKCFDDGTSFQKQFVQKFASINSQSENQGVMLCPIDPSSINLDYEEESNGMNLVQERIVLKVKTDALPYSFKSRAPFTCRLKLDLCNNSGDSAIENILVAKQRPKQHLEMIHNESLVYGIPHVGPSNDELGVTQDADSVPNENESQHCFSFNLNESQRFNFKRWKRHFRDFKHLTSFSFWDALDILNKQQESLHGIILKDYQEYNFIYDPLEIDLGNVKQEYLKLRPDDLVLDAKSESHIEIALYLPYVPGNLIPWNIQSIPPSELLMHKFNIKGNALANNDGSTSKRKRSRTIHEAFQQTLTLLNIMPTSVRGCNEFLQEQIRMRNYFFGEERLMYKIYKKQWFDTIQKNQRGRDLFAWGVLPVRALDMPNEFVPLPAGFKLDDINYPYTSCGFLSPHQCEGFGIADIRRVRCNYSLTAQQTYESVNTTRQTTHATRKRSLSTAQSSRVHDEEMDQELDNQPQSVTGRKQKVNLSPFSNLTGPNLRWMYTCMDTMNEGLYCIPDFRAFPINTAIKCHEYSMYKLDRFVTFDNRNMLVQDDLVLEDEGPRRLCQVWTRGEVRIFVEKYFMYPKCFMKIAQFIDTKTCMEVINFYYRFKYRLRLKERLHDILTTDYSKPETTRFLKRELHVQQSLDALFEECNSDEIMDFNTRNLMSCACTSDYLMRSGGLESGVGNHEIQIRGHRTNITTATDFQHTLENLHDGYVLPRKYNCVLVSGKVSVHARKNHAPKNSTRGCLLLDKGQSLENLNNAMAVALNTEHLIKLGRNPRAVINTCKRIHHTSSTPGEGFPIVKSPRDKQRQSKKRSKR